MPKGSALLMNNNDTAAPDALQRFRAITGKIKQFEELLGVVYWDMRTGAPRKGIAQRSEAVGALSAETFKLSTSAEMGELLAELTKPERFAKLGEIDRRLVAETNK